MARPTPCGAWRSPITTELIVKGAVGLGAVRLDGDDVYWLEQRPTEGGRSALVCLRPGREPQPLLPPPWNVRTRVHEYGGGAYAVDHGTVVFTNFVDQRLYRLEPDAQPVPLTPDSPRPDLRHADLCFDRRRGRLLAVQEDHRREGAPTNRIVAVDLEGEGEPQVLVEGSDFYAAPQLSPDGRRLAWLTWDQPAMPWDGTELWVGELDDAGQVADTSLVAGGPEESVVEPRWSPSGELHFASDRTGWWNLYRLGSDGAVDALAPREAEFSGPLWSLGLSSYDFAGPDRLVCTWSQAGTSRLGVLEGGRLRELELPDAELASVHADPAGRAVLIAGSPVDLGAVARIDLATGERTVLRAAGTVHVERSFLSAPEPLSFESAGGRVAHALYYRPQNPEHTPAPGERPPLLVLSHGGPTSAAGASLQLGIQFWTSRGFAVVDVNYGGSSGYGRAYRNLLRGRWGIVDVEDCVAAARHLADRGEVDPARLAIRGGSAGGYTTLCALTFTDAFHAGASHYGVSDLEALARDTHKFEARYLDSLVGPYPERQDLYRERSPIHHTERLSCPVILLQGLDDPVVPPNQAEMMRDALQAKGIPVAYVPFPGEQHGFRQAANRKRALEAELYFYGKVFGFEPADTLEPVEIANLA